MNLNVKGWNSHVHREFPGNVESTHLSREILSREIGRNTPPHTQAQSSHSLGVRPARPAEADADRRGRLCRDGLELLPLASGEPPRPGQSPYKYLG